MLTACGQYAGSLCVVWYWEMMNSPGEYFYSDEAIFFDPAVRRLESPDGTEKVLYPTSGFTRMDGFFGSIKPRHFSLLMPLLFFFIYWAVFLWTMLTAVL